jgi:uncharacterized protein YjbJ (UPF0337 family)
MARLLLFDAPRRRTGPAHERSRRKMNWDHVKADWDQVKGKLKSKWGKLTDDDIKLIGGKWDQLVGKLRHHYGYEKDDAERQVDEFLKKN